MQIKVLTLGAGQDIGRSCVIVYIGGKTIMFDCGMHMSYSDNRRYPDFSLISKSGRFTEAVDAVIVTHFHLDHCGALPFFTEVKGYDGPVIMTHPTKAMFPLMLEDSHKILTEVKGEAEAFSCDQIRECARKVQGVDLHQTIQIEEGFEICAYYAGHVLGAAMFHVKVGSESVVYTGDYNMTPDRHLGAAHLPRLRPDLLITESTNATTLRDSKRTRESDFLNQVVDTVVTRKGKVLIPVFAVGRAQELCILLDEIWDRLKLQVPIYFSAGMTAKANAYYQLLISWTSEKLRNSFVQTHAFAFPRIKMWERTLMTAPGPCVLFATPGMLNGGTSLEVFKAWAPDPKNLVLLPNYCVAGTVGNKLLSSSGVVAKKVEIDKRTAVVVNCRVKALAFSAHTDVKGILQLIQNCAPKNVMLVHGERGKMEFLSSKIKRSLGMACYVPSNGSIQTMCTSGELPALVSRSLLDKAQSVYQRSVGGRDAQLGGPQRGENLGGVGYAEVLLEDGYILAQENESGGVKDVRLVAGSEVAGVLGEAQHELSLECSVDVGPMTNVQVGGLVAAARDAVAGAVAGEGLSVEFGDEFVACQSFHARICQDGDMDPARTGKACFSCSWLLPDNGLALRCIAALSGAPS